MKTLILTIYLTTLFLLSATSTYSQSKTDSSNDSRSIEITTTQKIYDVKRDLLLTELQIRAAAHANVESILYQCRLALVTVIIGFLFFLFNRDKNTTRNEEKKLISLSRPMMVILIMVIFFAYWSDCYVLELQNRIANRVSEINYNLNNLPTMESREIEHLSTFPSLQQNNFIAKIYILFPPNFSQVVAYFPLVVMVLFSIIQLYKKK